MESRERVRAAESKALDVYMYDVRNFRLCVPFLASFRPGVLSLSRRISLNVTHLFRPALLTDSVTSVVRSPIAELATRVSCVYTRRKTCQCAPSP